MVLLETLNLSQAIQQATASEPLTLEEEYANQESWRVSHDKLTFIVCQPVLDPSPELKHVDAAKVDSDERMVGDVNFFIYPHDDDCDESSGRLYEEIGRAHV